MHLVHCITREMSFHGHDSFADNVALVPTETSLDADGGDVGVGGITGGELAPSDGEEDSDLPHAPPGGGPTESNPDMETLRSTAPAIASVTGAGATATDEV